MPTTFCRHNIGFYALDMNTKCALWHHIIPTGNKRKRGINQLTGWFLFYICVILIVFSYVYHEGQYHCRQRAPVENVPSASGTSHLGMIHIQATTKSKYYDHIVLLYLESRRCRYRSIIFVCLYLLTSSITQIWVKWWT